MLSEPIAMTNQLHHVAHERTFCPKRLRGTITEAIDVNQVAYMEVVGFSRGCAAVRTVLTSGGGSITAVKRYALDLHCNAPRAKHVEVCFEGVHSYNGPLEVQCTS